ncbi:MAG: secondary thiamine-phosphate synthase enzyme YjbQ [Metallosphaera sp.]|uniref:Secondary thiamine-phosphate synthase enzyme n=1 Tax=Metallosphaera cuprina (strain Ar-4) TaxID=1006006 RepID=F4FYC9_METCR|nr:secondary thiamine-phosphate synthase enzyme YjbQ [Metallosphaera cuprina]AEB94248.1 conserved hypothetical protein [Metallosphaera cuprina Ar-4]
MKVLTQEFEIKTSSRFQSIDITNEVQNSINNVKDGMAFVVVKHTTCAVILNEAEPGLMDDYLTWMRKLIPTDGEFKHNMIDNNGHAHISSMIIGNSRMVPVRDGKLDLGTWQKIILLEFDGPRTRKVQVKVMGE